MTGQQLLAELLALSRRQSEALAVDDLAEFDELADRRETLIRAMPGANWSGCKSIQEMAQQLLTCDARNEERLRDSIARVAQELASVRHATNTMRGYRSLAEAARQPAAILDRPA